MKKLLLFLLATTLHAGEIRFSSNGVFGSSDGFLPSLNIAGSSEGEDAEPRPEFALLRDVKASGTGGGNCTNGSFVTRTINEETIAQDWVSISSNQFTLLAGEYLIQAWSPAHNSALTQALLYNITGTSVVGYGSNAYSNASKIVHSRVEEVVDIEATTAFEIRHRCSNATTNSFGVASSFSIEEVYTIVSIRRLAD